MEKLYLKTHLLKPNNTEDLTKYAIIFMAWVNLWVNMKYINFVKSYQLALYCEQINMKKFMSRLLFWASLRRDIYTRCFYPGRYWFFSSGLTDTRVWSEDYLHSTLLGNWPFDEDIYWIHHLQQSLSFPLLIHLC